MQRTILFLALTMLANVAFVAAVANAGGHNNSGNHNQGNNFNHQHKPQFTQGKKVLGNNKNGMGFIADPIRRPLTTKTNPTQGNFIADPLHLPTNNPSRVAPVLRDHTLPNPNAVVSNPRPRYDSINGGGLGLDLNPFDFQAPMQFNQQVDKRTNPYPGSGRSGGGHKQPWTPSSTGPANRSPVKP